MTLLRTLGYAGLLAFLGLSMASCLNPPNYPDTPEIEFKDIKQQRLSNRFGTYDSVTVTVSFKDGDGDLGLDNSDTNPPFNQVDANGQPNRYYNNYFLTFQRRNSSNVFEDLALGGFDFNSRYPRLSPPAQGDRKAPLKGDLSFGLRVFKSPPVISSGTVLRFRVKILDRALHESNEVTTDPITIP